MIVVLADSVDEHGAMMRLVDGVRHRGDDKVRRLLADCRFVFIGAHPSPTVARTLASAGDTMQSELMTRTDTARRLSCSTSTVDRLAAAGILDKRNGKITTASIDRYVRGETE